MDVTIGEIVTNNVTAVYTFTVAPGQVVYFDEQSTVACWSFPTRWKVTDETGVVVLDETLGVSDCIDGQADAGLRTLQRGGNYTVSVTHANGGSEPYRFKIWDVPHIPIALSQAVTNDASAIFTFTAATGQVVYFDEQSTVACWSFPTRWKVTDETGVVVLDETLGVSGCGDGQFDGGLKTLQRGGNYTVTVTHANGGSEPYRFKIWDVPHIPIALNQAVTNDASAIFTFTTAPGQVVYFDEQSTVACWTSPTRWKITDETGVVVLDETLGVSGCGDGQVDGGLRTLQRGGNYTVSVTHANGGSEPYRFKIWDVPHIPIALNQAVTNDASAIFTFTTAPGQVVYFDEQSTVACWTSPTRWKITDETGVVVLDETLGVSDCIDGQADSGFRTLQRGGTYTVAVTHSSGGSEPYRFEISSLLVPDRFAIQLGDLVTNAVPALGAGNIERPGAMDVYSFSVRPGQAVFIDVLEGNSCSLRRKCSDEVGRLLWDNEPLGTVGCGESEPRGRWFGLGGTYTLTVSGLGDFRGSYAFRMSKLDTREIQLGEVITNNVPATYTFTARPGQRVYFDEQGYNDCATPRWRVTDVEGTKIVNEALGVIHVFGIVLDGGKPELRTLERGGTYIVEVEVPQDGCEKYEFGIFPVETNCSPNQLSSLSLGITSPKSGAIVTNPAVRVEGTVGFGNLAAGLDMVLVLDSSTSLAETDPRDMRKSAAKEFLSAIPSGSNLRVGLVDFDDDASLLQPLTRELDEVVQQIEALDQSGNTKIGEGLRRALQELEEQSRADASKAIILFTDGPSQDYPFETAMEAGRRNIAIHTVFLGASGAQGMDLEKAIAQLSCGNFRRADDPDSLSAVLAQAPTAGILDRIEVLSEAGPGRVFPARVVGNFWSADGIPVRTSPQATTELTVLAYALGSSQPVNTQRLRVGGGIRNTPPRISSITDMVLANGASSITVPLTIVDDETDPTRLVLTSSSSNENLIANKNIVFAGVGEQRTVSFTSTAGRTGRATLFLTVTDEGGLASNESFDVSVLSTNRPPIVDIVNPVPEMMFTVPSVVLIKIDSKDPDGPGVIVDVFANEQLIGTLFEPPFVLPWSPSIPGRYELTAKATDNMGLSTTSPPIRIDVLQEPRPPQVEILGPLDGETFRMGNAITIDVVAEAFDGKGAIVDIGANGKNIGTLFDPPYVLKWSPPSAGVYRLSAKATDAVGLSASSPVVVISVIEPPGCNVLTNGAFESVGVMIDSDYSTGNLVQEASVGISENSGDLHPAFARFGDHTTGTGRMLIVNGASDTNKAIWRQSVEFRAGQAYNFSVWAATAVSSAPARLALFVDGVIRSPVLVLPSTTGEWVQLSSTFHRNQGGFAKVEIRNLESASFGNDFVLDDVSLCPENEISIQLTTPRDGSLFRQGELIPLVAELIDPKASVMLVEFYSGTNKIGQALQTPWRLDWVDASAGSHDLTAHAILKPVDKVRSEFQETDEEWKLVSLPDQGPYNVVVAGPYLPGRALSSGSPDAHLYFQDRESDIFWWQAPAKFLGDQSRFCSASVENAGMLIELTH